MGAILRWFYTDGTRHRAWIRRSDRPAPDDRPELVIAAGDWQATTPVSPETSLEQYSEQRLSQIALELRAIGRGSGTRMHVHAG